MLDGVKVRLNKPAHFETVTDEACRAFFDGVPSIQAVGAEKFEPGAHRAIYPTSVRDSFIMSHPLNVGEPLLHRI